MSRFVRTYGEPPKLARGGMVSRAGHAIQAGPGFVIGDGGEGSATVSTSHPRPTAPPSRTEEAGEATQTSTRLPLFLKTIPASYQVNISSTAVRSMQNESRHMWLRSGGDMHETGGWLMSHRQWPDRVVVATQPGGDAAHWRSQMRLGTEALERTQDFLPHLCVRGSWHVHPGDDDGTPSATDRKAWARWRELDGGYHIGLILIRGEASGWTEPQIRAWLTTSEFCEPLAWKEY